jgi:hypothetical protein
VLRRLAGPRSFHPLRIDDFGNPIILFSIPPDSIQEVVLGVNSSPALRSAVANAILGRKELSHVRLFVSRCSPTKYALRRSEASLVAVAKESAEPEKTLADFLDQQRLITDLREAIMRLPDARLEQVNEWLSRGGSVQVAMRDGRNSKNLAELVGNMVDQELIVRKLAVSVQKQLENDCL